MKVSELITYLAKYLAENGDVDLDVDFSGNPKSLPPTTKTYGWEKSNMWLDYIDKLKYDKITPYTKYTGTNSPFWKKSASLLDDIDYVDE